MKVNFWVTWQLKLICLMVTVCLISACGGVAPPTPAVNSTPAPTFLGIASSKLATGQIAIVENHEPEWWLLEKLPTQETSIAPTVLVRFNRAFDYIDFSPDDKYLLFEADRTWWQRTPDGATSPLSEYYQHIRFARYWSNGSLLIGTAVVTGTLSGTLSLRMVDPSQLDSVRLQEDRVRYSFTTQLPDLAKLRSITAQIPAVVTCPSVTSADQGALLTIQADGSADLLVATQPQLAGVHSHFVLSPGNLAILQKQDTIITSLLAPYASVAANREELTPSYWINSNLGGVLSPDVQHPRLLFLLVDVSKDTPLYTLYLMDLLDKVGQPKELSTRTTWLPNFSFSPDGSHILYETEENDKHKLYRANADGTNPVLVTAGNTGQSCWY